MTFVAHCRDVFFLSPSCRPLLAFADFPINFLTPESRPFWLWFAWAGVSSILFGACCRSSAFVSTTGQAPCLLASCLWMEGPRLSLLRSTLQWDLSSALVEILFLTAILSEIIWVWEQLLAPRPICGHKLAQRFGPNLLETRDFQIGLRGFEERKRSKRCTKCCPAFWGHVHYKTGEKRPFLSKCVATDRSRAN